MNTSDITSRAGESAVRVTRVALTQWQAVADDLVVGHGDLSTRPDGRLFVSIDAWDRDAVFDRIAEAILAKVRRPLHTVVDEGDTHLLSCWERAGFTVARREWEYLVPTDPKLTGLHAVRPPSGITIVSAGRAAEHPLREVDRAIRDEVGASVGWQEMPVEILGGGADTVVDPSKYVVAADSQRYVGLARVVRVTRLPRIGLIAVRADHRRRGTATAMLSHILGGLHERGITTAAAEVKESNTPATALFEGVGARRVNSNLELVLR
ncbi:GNAT family N-acetyltransferase [Nocardia sp. ET3-3]|uniref:GNAT family N-acetyltransferase n=1 Tax=Nocardia terrae TaxID=2675851 RepID=A0A7K1V1L1_9NOCA|nr:GNAT family N-acetyltransferase [Nocardia terrae]MVU80530.1 GNAT family N-acetyltransferase [Nocardia terrae]